MASYSLLVVEFCMINYSMYKSYSIND